MNIGNNHKSTKPLVLVLLFSIALSIASCYSKETKRKNQKISADTPWYDAEIIDFKPELNLKKKLSYLSYAVVGSDENNIVVFSDGSYQVKAWTDDVEYKDYLIKIVTFLDRKTKQSVKDIDIGVLIMSFNNI